MQNSSTLEASTHTHQHTRDDTAGDRHGNNLPISNLMK